MADEDDPDSFARVLNSFSGVNEAIVKELMRHRAWESILYLLVARYYVGKSDPIGAATHDRDFLAKQRREMAQDEDGARQIEKTYQAIFVMIDAAQQQKLAGERDDADDKIM